MNKTIFLLKVNEGDLKSTENSVANSLIDKLGICQPIKSFCLYKQKGFSYIALQGHSEFTIPVLESIRKRLVKKDIFNKIFRYKLDNSKDLVNLITKNISCNTAGYVIENYDSESLMMKSIKRLTNKFLTEEKLVSKHVFCPKCKDGYGTMVTLTSLQSHYHCSYCDTDILVDGPLLTKKITLPHISEAEGQFIVTNYKPEFENIKKEKSSNQNFVSVEQMMWPQIKRIKPISGENTKRIRRTKHCKLENLISIEQLKLNLA